MVAVAIINSIIGGSTGGMCVLFFNKYILKQKWSYLMSLNGALTGIVIGTAVYIFSLPIPLCHELGQPGVWVLGDCQCHWNLIAWGSYLDHEKPRQDLLVLIFLSYQHILLPLIKLVSPQAPHVRIYFYLETQ